MTQITSFEQYRNTFNKARHRLQYRSIASMTHLMSECMHTFLDPSFSRPHADSEKRLKQSIDELLERDWKNAEVGYYSKEHLFKFSLLKYWNRIPALCKDLPQMLAQRDGAYIESSLPRGIDLEDYPKYYRRRFHSQTDGWLSERSARIWDLQADLFFLGTASVQQRMIIPHLIDGLKHLKKPRVLDVGCGTASFFLQLHSACPHLELCALDISPYYLMQARKLLAHIPAVTFLIENAEKMRLPDASFDGVTAIGLLHELPHVIRRKVIQEIARVIRPGGMFVLSDALQFSDQTPLEYYLLRLQKYFHEPFLKSYMNDDIVELLTENGFAVQQVETGFLLKNFVAKKTSKTSDISSP